MRMGISDTDYQRLRDLRAIYSTASRSEMLAHAIDAGLECGDMSVILAALDDVMARFTRRSRVIE